MTHPETNLQSKYLRSTVENLHFHTSRLSLSVASTKSPRHSLAPWVRPLQPGICILRSALSRTRTHLSPPGTVTLLGYDPSSPGSPISDLHSHTRTRIPLSPPGTVTLLGYEPSSPGSPFSDLHSHSHTNSSKPPRHSHAPWVRPLQPRISAFSDLHSLSLAPTLWLRNYA